MANLVPSIILPYLIEWLTYDKALYDSVEQAQAYAALMNITLDIKIELPARPTYTQGAHYL